MYPLVPLSVDELTWVGWLLLVSLPGLGSVGALLRAPSEAVVALLYYACQC